MNASHEKKSYGVFGGAGIVAVMVVVKVGVSEGSGLLFWGTSDVEKRRKEVSAHL